MSNKMLIDASHPEETRVAVVRGNRIEEFDFESQEKKQLRGNIYLAKVTRVEPSLQAAFVDYGGNRHGFLAFSEIHPDYYQIPVADRQALLEAEAEEARAMREAEEAEDDERLDASETDADDDEEQEEAPAPKPRRRSRRTRKTASENAAEDAPVQGDEAKEADEPVAEPAEKADEEASAAAEDTASEETASEETSSKRRRTTRTRRPRKKTAEAAEADAQAAEPDTADADGNTAGDDTPAEDGDGEDGPDSSGTIAAMIEMDSISEPLPGEEDGEEAEATEDVAETPETAEDAPAPKRRSRSRKKAEKPEEDKKAEAEAGETEAVAADITDQDGAAEKSEQEEEEKPKKTSRKRAGRRKSAKAEAEATAQSDSDEEEAEPEKPKPRRGRKAKKEEVEDDGGNGSDVESVGQEDALEELPSPRRNRRQYKIQEVIKRRQVMLIQVVKEERGNKGAALTTYLSLAGRYSVLMPNTARGGGISRKITSSGDRKRLKTIASELEVPEGMGVILRTAGASRTKDEIERDFQYLMRLWEQVRNLTLASTAPCLVYEEGSLIKRSIRDLYSKETGEIMVAGEAGYEEARSFMEMLMPEHVDRVQAYDGAQAIFTKFGVEAQLDNMLSPQVTLKSGGYLVINQTEALVAVDVNSGRATREHSVEKTALQTNLEAAEEVARQLRLRDLAGLIVIDFIDMEERRNNRAVEKKLKDCLKSDRARIQVGRISHFGLLEMSRQRMRASVLESTMDMCPHCSGTGYIRSESAIALHVFRALEEHVERNRNRSAILHTTPEIAAHLLNHKRASLVELESRYGIQIVVLGDAGISGQDFKIEKGEKSRQQDSTGPIGYEGDSARLPSDTDEDGDGGRKKRGKRRRRRGPDEETAETDLETGSDGEAEDRTSEDTADDDEKPRKRRRRGRRSGRKKQEASEETATQEDAEDADGGSSDWATAEAGHTGEEREAQSVPAEETEAKPRSRSTRRKKAPIAESADAETSETPAGSEEQASAPPPPRPRRRTTRRKKEEPEVTSAGEEETPAEEAPGTTVEAQSAPAESVSEPVEASGSTGETSEEKPTKRGWWNRGGGFF